MKQLDPHSITWLVVREAAEKELGICRAKLEVFSVDDRMTAYLRGQVAALKKVLALEAGPANSSTASHAAPGDGYQE